MTILYCENNLRGLYFVKKDLKIKEVSSMNSDEMLMKILNKVHDMDNTINTLDNKVDKMEIQLNENTKILRALEHNSQVHKAEMVLSIKLIH